MKYLLLLIILTPLVSSAAPETFADLVGILLELIGLMIPFIFGLTLLVLFWGITKAWIINSGDAAEIEKGKKLVVAGIIALVIMSGIWGIIGMLRSSLFG